MGESGGAFGRARRVLCAWFRGRLDPLSDAECRARGSVGRFDLPSDVERRQVTLRAVRGVPRAVRPVE